MPIILIIKRHNGIVVERIGDNDQEHLVLNYEHAIERAIKKARGENSNGRLITDPKNYKLVGLGTVVKIGWITPNDERFVAQNHNEHNYLAFEVRPIPTVRQLLCLMYASNPCYVTVSRGIPESVELDKEQYRWRHKTKDERVSMWYPIGFPELQQNGYEVIGIFDREDDDHLNRMVNVVREVTLPKCYDEDRIF